MTMLPSRSFRSSQMKGSCTQGDPHAVLSRYGGDAEALFVRFDRPDRAEDFPSYDADNRSRKPRCWESVAMSLSPGFSGNSFRAVLQLERK